MGLRGLIALPCTHPSAAQATVPFRSPALELVANRPIVEHVVAVLVEAGVDEILVALPRRMLAPIGEALTAVAGGYGARLRFVAAGYDRPLSHTMALAAPLIGADPCIVHVGDGLLDESLPALLHEVRLDRPDLTILMPAAAAGIDLTLDRAGVLVCGRGTLERVVASAPEGTLTAIGLGLDQVGGVLRVASSGWRRYDGDYTDLLRLNHLALDRIGPGHHTFGTGNQIEGRVHIDASAIVEDSVINGPVLIGPGAVVSHAYIGPYTTVGEGAQLEGVEIERSIIAADASVMNIPGRLTGSVVGRGARIFRDFSLPRAIRLRVSEGTEIAMS